MTDTPTYTFGNSAALLRQNGYAAAPLSDSGQPLGPVMVRQHDYNRWPENQPLPLAALTWVPPPRSEHDPVQNPAEVRLAILTVKVSEALAGDVDAIIANHTRKSKCPVRIEGDGSLRFVFQLTEEPFPSVQAAHNSDRVTVESGPSWIPLNGNWREGLDLLDVRRSDLPEMSKALADALVSEIDALLEARAPRWEPPVYVKRPLLAPGQRLLYGNTRALNQLAQNGFKTLLPVRFGDQQPERSGYVAEHLGKFLYNVDLSAHGIGVMLEGLVTIETITPWRPDVDAILRQLGTCMIQSVEGDESRRLYVFRCAQNGTDQSVYSPFINLAVRRRGLLLLSGANENGRSLVWESDILQARVDELASFEPWDVDHLQRALATLPYIKHARRRA